MSRDSEKREHNRYQLEDWLNYFTERFPSGPQEILRVENRKLEGKAPLKMANYLRMKDIPYDNSDKLLLRLLSLLRLFYPDEYGALDVYLNPDRSTGDIDILNRDAARKGGKKAREAREELKLMKAAKEQILKWLDWVYWPDAEGEPKVGHWLAIPKKEKAQIIGIAVSRQEQEAIRAEYLINYEALEGMPERQRRARAATLTMESTKRKKTWVYHCTKDVRKEGESGDSP